MRQTIAAALIAAVCSAAYTYKGYTASEIIDYLKTSYEPEYAAYYRDAIKQTGVTFAQVEAKLEDVKAQAIAAGYSPSQVAAAVSQYKAEFVAEVGVTYADFKSRFLSWYRGYSLSLYSGSDALALAEAIRADPAKY